MTGEYKMLKKVLLICAMLCQTIYLQAVAAEPEDAFVTLCLKNKDYLLTLEKSKGIKQEQKISRLYTRGYQFKSEPLGKLFEKKTDESYRFTVEEKGSIIFLLQDIGKVNLYQGMLYYSPVIKSEIISEIIISALRSNSPDVRARAADALEGLSQENLERFSEQILSVVKNNRHFPRCEFVYFPPSRQKEFSYLKDEFNINKLESTDLQDKAIFLCIRAKLGEETASDEMIQDIETTTDFRYKRRLVRYLGLIGDKKCIIALLEALNDNQEPNKGQSLRYLILPAIWRNYPDDELFVKYCPWLVFGDKYIGGKTGVKEFYDKIQEWAKKKLDFDLDLSKAKLEIFDPYGTVHKYPKGPRK
jgi:hypothetical protein